MFAKVWKDPQGLISLDIPRYPFNFKQLIEYIRFTLYMIRALT